MLLDAVRQSNWLDIFIVILLIRTIYVSLKRGFSTELFKLLGIVAATYISLHYFTAISDFIRSRSSTGKMPLEFLDFLCFLVLASITNLIFVFLRKGFFQFIKIEAVSGLNKWGGLIFGLGRGFLLVGLIIFGLTISSIKYFKNSVSDSYSGKRMSSVAADTYTFLWDKFWSKFMSGEEYNSTVLEVQDRGLKE
ncbi:CvpA family protein [Candidatus Omnitrophota bacterium]